LGIGDWGLGIGPNPQSPIPNPQTPIPNFYFHNEIRNINDFKYKSFNKNYLQNIYKKSNQLKGKKTLVL